MGAEARKMIRELVTTMRRTGSTTPTIVRTIMDRWGTPPLVAYRHAFALSQTQIADRYNERWPEETPKTFKQVSYWERWRGPGAPASGSARPPSLQDLGRLAVLFGCRVDDLLYGPRDASGPPALIVSHDVIGHIVSALQRDGQPDYPESDDGSEPVAVRSILGEGTITVTMSRRAFSSLLAGGGLAALLPGAVSSPASAEPGTAAFFRRTLVGHQAGHHLLTPGAHIASLVETLRDIADRRDTVSGPYRRDLRAVQAEIAEHLSWLHREIADTEACRHWAGKASAWAMEAGDTSMATYMMLRTASLALDHRDFARVLDIAQTVRHTEWPTPPVLQAVACLYEARAQAAAGTIDAAALDAADELLAAPRSADDPPYLRFYGTAFGDLQRATCYVSAGEHERAVTIFQAQLTGLPATHYRDRAVHLVRLGLAHAVGQAPDAAALAGLAGLTEARRSGSKHVLTELKPLADLLQRRWPDQQKVREFRAALAAV
ncbi:hypothetical protein ACWDRB_47865 [Nonomuraea sp. NPDC003707]